MVVWIERKGDRATQVAMQNTAAIPREALAVARAYEFPPTENPHPQGARARVNSSQRYQRTGGTRITFARQSRRLWQAVRFRSLVMHTETAVR